MYIIIIRPKLLSKYRFEISVFLAGCNFEHLGPADIFTILNFWNDKYAHIIISIIRTTSKLFLLLKNDTFLEKFWKKNNFLFLCNFSTSDDKKKQKVTCAMKIDRLNEFGILANRFLVQSIFSISWVTYFGRKENG